MKQLRFWLGAFFLFVLGMWVSSILNLQTFAQPVFREGNQIVENWRFRDMETKTSEHFTIMYPADRSQEGELMLQVAERVYRAFTSDYVLPSEQTITLVLFPDRTGMQERFGWPYEQSATGVYYGGVIYLLSPDDWMNTDVPPLSDTKAWKEYVYKQGPLVHELAHYYLDQKANGNFPRWYTEGFAQWVEFDMIGYEWIVPHNKLHNEPLYEYAALHDSFDQLENQALAYRQAFMWYRYLLEEYGEEKMEELHTYMQGRLPFSKAWLAVYGRTETEMFAEWETRVKEEEIR